MTTPTVVPFGQVYSSVEHRGFRFIVHREFGPSYREHGEEWAVVESWPDGCWEIEYRPLHGRPVRPLELAGEWQWPSAQAAMDALADHLAERYVGLGL